MKRQLLVTQLAVLFEKRATDHRLDREALAPGLLDAMPAQILRRQHVEIAMVVQPPRNRLQLAADLVIGEAIEQGRLDGAFLTHCRLRRLQFRLSNQ